ncbi:hypothetical protein MNBD_DELTA04-1322 [hydrothermal vent metagenome]|uniref:Uncharacterized protein n=1 Tax=hydrothermal vent metagenome TaxID=652676 RepID=A0A3B0V2P5_9ZZZZ
MKKTGKSFVLAGLLLAGIVSAAVAGEMPIPGPAPSDQGAVSAAHGLFSGRMDGNETARQTAATIRDKMAVQREQHLEMVREHQQQALGKACNIVNEARQPGPAAGGFQNHVSAGFRGQAIRPAVHFRPRFR